MSMLHSLWKSYHIMGSDEDQLVVEDLYVGFGTYMRFVVTIEHVDNEKPEYSCSVSAIVNKEDAFKLSKKLKSVNDAFTGCDKRIHGRIC